MAKWDLSKLPEGRKPLPDEWFAERAQMQERIKGLETLLWAADYDAKEAEAYAGELEANLARALEVLSDLADCVDDGCFCSEVRMAAVMDYAYITLAELTSGEAANGEAKGGKDE